MADETTTETAPETGTAVLDAPKPKAAKAKAPKPKAGKQKPKAGKAAKVVKAAGKFESVHAEEPTREPKWSLRRVAVVKAMRALGAVDKTTARTAEDIAKKAGTVDGIKLADRVDLVKIILDVYRTAELLHNGYAASTKYDGERGLRYYLTAKGQKTEMVNKQKKAKDKAAA